MPPTTPFSSSSVATTTAALAVSSVPSSASQSPGKAAWQTAVCLMVAFGVLAGIASALFWRGWIDGNSRASTRVGERTTSADVGIHQMRAEPELKPKPTQKRRSSWQRWERSVGFLRRFISDKFRRAQAFQRLSNSTQSFVSAPIVPEMQQHIARPMACVPRNAALRSGANPWSVDAQGERGTAGVGL